NGHTRLPNQGLNSFLIGLEAQYDYSLPNLESDGLSPIARNFNRSSYNYIEFRTGIGQNALSNYFNQRKEVYSLAVSYGKVINRTFKFGGGFYYRFYEHYYDYIRGEKQYINEEYPEFKEKPFLYASTYGIFGSFELLLNHVGLEVNIGANFSKPFYEIDWRISQGFSHTFENSEGVIVIGVEDTPFSTKYEIKKVVSSRMGVKYYFWATEKLPLHNLYIGAHINANLGQADFSEFSVGYIYSFNFKD
ncbi:MAG: deacylase, partial [Flavobacteriaceae bacterium]|nr:deacylase [Flavobacteriaceae bacterium]